MIAVIVGAIVLTVIGACVFAVILFVRVGRLNHEVSELERRLVDVRTEFAELSDALGAAIKGRKPPGKPKQGQGIKDKDEEVSTEAARSEEKSSEETPDSQKPAAAAADAVSGADKISEPRKPRNWKDFEQKIGARWSVLLGGLAMALGTVFLVKYSIDSGWLGPAQRIIAGFAVSAGLLGAGEWLRRKDKELSIPVIENADIPGILTGSGVIGAFASLYAGHALYGFFGPAVAFVGLTAIGIASLVLSSLHGPKLAAIGVVGAFAVPLLVSSTEPNSLALAIHVLVVTASVMTVSRLRKWLWLAFAGVAGATVWTCLAAGISDPANGIAGMMMILGSAGIFAATFGWQLVEILNPPEDLEPNKPAIIAFGALAFAYTFQLAINENLFEIATGSALALLIMGTGFVWASFGPVSLIATLVIVLTCAKTGLPVLEQLGLDQTQDVFSVLRPADISAYLLKVGLVLVPSSVVGLLGSKRAAASAPKLAGWISSGVGLAVFLTLLIVYIRIAPFETRPLFGLLSLAGAFAFAVMAEMFVRARPDDLEAPAPAAMAVTSIALISFAIGVSLSKVWMPFGFAVSAAGIAAVYSRRPVVVLPWLAVLSAALAGFSLWFSVPFHGTEIGTTPFLNSLIVLVGLPAVAILVSGELLRHRNAEPHASIALSIGLAALALFVALQLRHWINDGEIAGGRFGLADMAVQTIAALGFTIGLQFVSQRTGASIFNQASLVAGVISIAVAVLGLLVVFNPMFNGEDVGNTVFVNLLLPGYLVTAALAGIIAWLARPIRPRWYTLGYAGLCGLLLFNFVTGTTRHAYQGGMIELSRYTSELEFWTYSAVWLVLGVVVLGLGFRLRSLPVRLAAAALIALTVVKVFLLDMGELTGVLRALSFLGLGGFLILIGRYYQRILFGLAKEEESQPG